VKGVDLSPRARDERDVDGGDGQKLLWPGESATTSI
jgi:hypothetical protein